MGFAKLEIENIVITIKNTFFTFFSFFVDENYIAKNNMDKK